MKTCTMEITIAIAEQFDDATTDADIREALGCQIDELIQNTDIIHTLTQEATIHIDGH